MKAQFSEMTPKQPNNSSGASPPAHKEEAKALAVSGEKLKKQELLDLEQKKLFPPVAAPTIYAFSWLDLDSANPELGAVKVGDTHERDYKVRLNWWRKKYKDIDELGHTQAYFDYSDGVNPVRRLYFRDYEIHKVLRTLNYKKLLDIIENQASNVAIPRGFSKEDVSQEFYAPQNNVESISQEVINMARDVIIRDYEQNKGAGEYKTYDDSIISSRNKNNDYAEEAVDDFQPYEYQRKAVEELTNKFLDNSHSIGAAQDEVKKRRIIIDAPTRSGKSYMLCWGLKAIIQKQNQTFSEKSIFSTQGFSKKEDRTLTVITSGVPAVFDEFRRTIQNHEHLNGFFYWMTREELKEPGSIDRVYEEGYRHIVVALSLQDLAGREQGDIGGNDLKAIHKHIEGRVSYVLGDECHFAMFSNAETYKAALEEATRVDDEQEQKEIQKHFESGTEFSLQPEHGYIFSSATTYSILDKDFFDPKRDIVFISPYEIQDEMEHEIRKAEKEGDPLSSPFFGRPHKHFFGISLEAAFGEEMKASELFKAKGAGKFIHEEKVRSLLEAFYGIGKYQSLPDIFSNNVLQAAGAGRHVLWQMPSVNSCNALAKLLRQILKENGIDGDYHLFNVSAENNFYNKIEDLKSVIKKRRFEKTVTITVARFVTGVSIPEWDSVILANSGQSLTRRIQTYGRVETPWVESIENDQEDERTRYCQKPHCFVFDLNPEQLYDFSNQNERHARHLSENSSSEDTAMPGGNIFSYDGFRMHTMSRQDVHQQLDDYLQKREVRELASRIDPWGVLPLGDELREQIKTSGRGIKSKAIINVPEDELLTRDFLGSHEEDEEEVISPEGADSKEDFSNNEQSDAREKINDRDPEIKNYIYRQLMLAAIITEIDNPRKLVAKLQSSKPQDREYRLLASHLMFTDAMLHFLNVSLDNFYASDNLDTSIKALLARVRNSGESVEIDQSPPKGNGLDKGGEQKEAYQNESAERFLSAVGELKDLSNNEVFTPFAVADKMVSAMNLNLKKVEEMLGNSNPDFIDTGARSGVLLLKSYRRVIEIIDEALSQKKINKKRAEELKNAVGTQLVAIPTGPAAYEVIKALYSKMNWDQDNIIWCEAAPADVKCVWAEFIVKHTDLLLEIATMKRSDRGEALRKWLVEKDLLATIGDERADVFVAFLNQLSKTMSEKFDYTISNPPYQGVNRQQIYVDFYLSALKISDHTIMIFPEGWQRPVTANGLKAMNNEDVKRDKQIVFIDNYGTSIFEAGTTANIIFWKRGYDNNLDGKQKVLSMGKDPVNVLLPISKDDVEKPTILRNIASKLDLSANFSSIISPSRPYGLRTDVMDKPDNYPDVDYKKIYDKPGNKKSSLLTMVKRKRSVRYIDTAYLKKIAKKDNGLGKYKIFIPYAWGNFSKEYLGGAYSEIVLGNKNDACSETFLEIKADSKRERDLMAKLLLTKHLRALLFLGKTSQHSTAKAWKNIPLEDFSEAWWDNATVKELDQHLSKKYGYSQDDDVFRSIQELQWEDTVKNLSDYINSEKR